MSSTTTRAGLEPGNPVPTASRLCRPSCQRLIFGAREPARDGGVWLPFLKKGSHVAHPHLDMEEDARERVTLFDRATRKE
jgi:hypothetical protein